MSMVLKRTKSLSHGRKAKIYYDNVFEEYCVKIVNIRGLVIRGADYFTDSFTDAVETAALMDGEY